MVKLVWLLEQPFGRVERFKICARHMSQAGWPRGHDHRARAFGVTTLVACARAATHGQPWLPLAWLWISCRWPLRAMTKPLLALSPRCRVRHTTDLPHVMMLPLPSHHRRIRACPLHLYAVASPVRVASVACTWSSSPSPCH